MRELVNREECQSFISHTICPTDLLHPSPAPRFQTFQIFLIYFQKCSSFITIKSFAQNIEFH